MNEPTVQLHNQDAYALARAVSGLSTEGLAVSPGIQLILNAFTTKQPDDYRTLQRILREGGALDQVLKLDPQAPQSPAIPEEEPVTIPELPPEAHLSGDAIRAGAGVAGWLDEFMTWATARSPMTPHSFLQAGGIWTLGLAIARRCCVHLHAPIFPHLYILWIAPTSTFKKTTGMDAIADLVNTTMPHLLLPEESTPEAFVGALAGNKPSNYDSLSAYEKKIDDQGRSFAAQRGILIDEASSLIGATRKDYMQGLLEMILRLYDAPPRYTRNVRSEGKTVIREASLCILGATTPAALARSTNSSAWETGEFARYAMLFPDQDMPYDLGSSNTDVHRPPAGLVRRLGALHTLLPRPPEPVASDSSEPPKRDKLQTVIDTNAHAAYQTYARAVTYDLLRTKHPPDLRLQPNYARLHIQAVKIATALAAIDWADSGGKASIRITLGHWVRAQQMVEGWRASLHLLLSELDKGEEIVHQDKILTALEKANEGMSLRELSRGVRLSYKAIEATLKVLIDAGLVEERKRQNARGGPEAKVYRLVA
ncbi:MAG: ArsR/SmtB family transcription factor [Aggregatilineales bacterium]